MTERSVLHPALFAAGRRYPRPPARQSFTSGMHLVAAVSAVVLCAVAVCTPRLLGHVQPIGATQPHAAPPSPLELPVYGDAA